MWDTIQFLAAPFTACLLLVGILSYFGNHILSRGIIFIDIAVAQVAALGTMIGILVGLVDGSLQASLFSLFFTVVILGVFAISKFEHKEISQEVIIGIIYGLSLAIALLLVEVTPGGSNFVQKSLTGAILWVTWTDVLIMLIIFAIIGFIHIFFAKRFIEISVGNKGNFSKSQLKMLDLLFYVTFGFVVVKAVDIGGIFVIFTYLIAPASIGTIISTKWSSRLGIAWLMGFIGSVVGICISYTYNFPNGPTIVVVLGIFLVITFFIQRIVLKRA